MHPLRTTDTAAEALRLIHGPQATPRSREAGCALLMRHFGGGFERIALKWGARPEDVEDMFSSFMEKVLRPNSIPEDCDHLDAYLRAMLKNQLRDHLARTKRDRARRAEARNAQDDEAELDPYAGIAADPKNFDPMERAAERQTLNRFVKAVSLKGELAAATLDLWLAGLSHADIAQRLGGTEGASRTRVYELLELARRLFGSKS